MKNLGWASPASPAPRPLPLSKLASSHWRSSVPHLIVFEFGRRVPGRYVDPASGRLTLAGQDLW